jgi:hypothetical protein
MKDSNSTNSQGSAAPADMGFSPWQRLKTKRISYLTLPLLFMATVVEFVILATGWTYQRIVCVPQGMGVTFFGIGPIGATILAVELLKLPLAIWTASRHGWQKTFMLVIGLPLICVLTFQLVKDMAVYEMGVAMAPAGQLLEKAAVEETKIAHLNGELAAIEGKKTDRERKLAELAAKRNKAKTDLEELLKRNAETRQDAIDLTDFQKKELSEVEARQANIIKQFNADTEQINKALAELRARRETELARASKWTVEEARIENAYKAKVTEYTNKKATYDKEKAEYDNANFIRRKLMKEPVSPGVPPVREVNSIVKPTAIAEFDAEIKAKEAELLAVNNKRRERVAQVDADARRLREEYDRRSSTRREKTDTKREELVAAQAALTAEINAEEKLADQELAAVVKKVDGIRGEIDACRKKAEGHYEEREASIRKTQVHRIATTVEIVRGLIMGERPMSITATAKERGDRLTDQISMVRIWVYPVLAFIVAFLPTLMVEIGSSTVFQPERQRPAYRLGFLGRRLHWLYKRAGRQKILRAERLAIESSGEVAARDRALAAAKTAAAEQEERLKKMADSLNRAAAESDALRDSQKSEVERQIQSRQDAWSDRLTQMRKELDDQRAAHEAERAALKQEHQQKLMQVTEDSKAQVIQVRRQMADAELAAVEKSGKLANELKQAVHAREEVESQLKHQVDSLGVQLALAQEDAGRQTEKAAREEKHRLERQQLEFEKTLRQREEDFEHRLKQREQELALAFEGRLAEEKSKIDEGARLRQMELEHQIDNRAREVEARWKQEVQRREEATQIRFRQRDQQWQAQSEARLSGVQTQAEKELSRREAELKHQLEAKVHEAETRLDQQLQEKELAFEAKLKQREQELAAKADAREAELQKQFAARLRVREEELERQAEARVRATEARLGHELKEQEQLFLSKSRHQEQQWQVKLDGALAEAQLQTAAIQPVKEMLARAETERDEARQSAADLARQVQTLERKLKEASSFLSGWKDKLGDAA